jgi:hypothetical protein
MPKKEKDNKKTKENNREELELSLWLETRPQGP